MHNLAIEYQINKLTINNQTSARRCEVCHQSDRFDAGNNHCYRCGVVAVEQLYTKPKRPRGSLSLIGKMRKSNLNPAIGLLLISYLLGVFILMDSSIRWEFRVLLGLCCHMATWIVIKRSRLIGDIAR